MDAVTYPDAAVLALMHEQFVAVRLAHDHPALAPRYAVKHTPTQLVLDAGGAERHRHEGFLGPAEELAMLLLGKAKWLAAQDRSADALEALAQLLARPKAEAQAEGHFLRGRLEFERSGDQTHLKTMAETLAREFPVSPWNAKAGKYRLL